MILGLGGHSRRATRDQLEQEAADIIAELVAAGRPPPEVWRRAEEWRAANPPSGSSWYAPDEPRSASSTKPSAPAPAVSPELLPRTVRLPAGALDRPSSRRARPAPAEIP